MNYNIIVVGGGSAGMTAAIYAGRAGWKTLLVDPMGVVGRPSTADMISQLPRFSGWGERSRPHGPYGPSSKGFWVKIDYEEVAKVTQEGQDESGKAGEAGFKVSSGDTEYTARAVVYAAGSRPRSWECRERRSIWPRG